MRTLVASLVALLLQPAAQVAAQTAVPAQPGADPPAAAKALQPEIKGKPAPGGNKSKKVKAPAQPRKGKKG